MKNSGRKAKLNLKIDDHFSRQAFAINHFLLKANDGAYFKNRTYFDLLLLSKLYVLKNRGKGSIIAILSLH